MSALAGRLNFDRRPAAVESCQRMLAAQALYGPHASAAWDGGDVALGRRLFRLLPEDLHDRQPLIGGGGRYVLVADLRLDNRDELKDAFGLAAAEAARLCDAALLLRAWEEWGEGSLDRLLGDYAFAVWDGGDRRLHLARDPLGTRPLHYHAGNAFFAFASMPKGLHALAEVPYAADETRGAEFLAVMPEVGSRSFFDGVSRVEAGQVVCVTEAGLRARRYWEPQRTPLRLARAADYAEALRDHLDRAVAVRLRGGGGRVGTHLSAGLDSSAVAATAARLLAPEGGTVVAFTAVPREGYAGPVPEGGIGDESERARATAALYSNMESVLVRAPAGTLVDDLDRDFFLYDRPLVNAENQRWWNAINAEAGRRQLKVLLTGVMGNFTISYAGMTGFSEMLAAGRLLDLFRHGRSLVRNGHRWSRVAAAAVGPWLPEWAWNVATQVGRGWHWNPGEYSVLRRELTEELEFTRLARARGFDLSYRPRRQAFDARMWGMRRVDLGNNGKGALAGWGVDLRDPTTDRRLVEFCLSVPTEIFLEGGVPRGLARFALADRLPREVLEERGRGLQAIDWHEQLTAARPAIAAEIERLEGVPAAAAILDLERMRRLVEEWPNGGWDSHKTMRQYRMALLRGVVSGHFLRKASGTNT